MGSDIYVLGLSLSLRLNSEQLIYNSEKRAKFKITAGTFITFARDFFDRRKRRTE